MATIFSGGTYVNFSQFAGTFKCLIMQGIMNNLITAGWTKQALNTGWNPGIYGRSLQGPGNVGIVTMPTATPGVVNWAGHGFLGGEQIMFQAGTGGTLPGGIGANTVYYVNYIDGSTFNVSSSYNGSNIAFSGSPSGTLYCYSQYILMVSATQANVTNPTVIRLQDNTGTCVAVTCQHYSGNFFAGNGTWLGYGNGRYYGAQLVPVSSPNYQITATKYQFYVSQVGATSTRDFCLAGMIYVPSFMSVADHGYVLANSWDGETGNVPNSFRNTMNIGVGWVSNSQVIWNAMTSESANNNSAFIGLANPTILQNQNWYTTLQGYRWSDNSLIGSDILLASGQQYNQEGKLRGQFYDMIYISDAFALDATDTFGGHTWLNMTNNNTAIPRGGVWIATS